MEISQDLLLKVIGFVVMALVGVIKHLFKRLTTQGERHEERIKNQGDEQLKIAISMGRLEGKQEGVLQLSADVLQTVENATKKKCEKCVKGDEGGRQ